MGGFSTEDMTRTTQKNIKSLVLKFSYNGKSLLFFGDLEGKDAFEKLLTSSEEQLETDVMMLPHHGAHLYLREEDPPNNSPDYYHLLVTAGM